MSEKHPSRGQQHDAELSPLAREIGKKRPFDLPEQEAHLNMLRTVSILAAPFEALMREHGLSEATYNLLRILRGAGPQGRACHEIGCQMIARVPDVTRLVDRLERAGLAQRRRSAQDRRIVTVTITPRGEELLEKLDVPIDRIHRANLGHMGRDELAELSRLLVKARAPHAPGTDQPKGTP